MPRQHATLSPALSWFLALRGLFHLNIYKQDDGFSFLGVMFHLFHIVHNPQDLLTLYEIKVHQIIQCSCLPNRLPTSSSERCAGHASRQLPGITEPIPLTSAVACPPMGQSLGWEPYASSRNLFRLSAQPPHPDPESLRASRMEMATLKLGKVFFRPRQMTVISRDFVTSCSRRRCVILRAEGDSKQLAREVESSWQAM